MDLRAEQIQWKKLINLKIDKEREKRLKALIETPEMWINSKGSNICEIGVSEGERENKAEMFGEIILKT